MKRYIIGAALLLVAIPALAAEVGDWDVSDASNTDLFPENMSPALVNDGGRAVQGVVARWATDESCSIQSTGSSSAWSLSAQRTISTYYDGLKVCFDAHTGNDGTVTLNVDSVGAATIKKENDENLAAGDIETGQKVEVVYDGTNWQMLSPTVEETADDVITTRGDVIRGDSSGDAERLALGTPSQYLASDGTDLVWEDLPAASTSISGIQENATAAEMESETANRTVTADVVTSSPAAAKAWVHFTISGAAIGTVTGYNVSSVSYDGTGDYTVEFDTNFSSAAIACTATPLDSNTRIAQFTAITAGGISVSVENDSSNDNDATEMAVVCFGDQ